MKLLGTLVLSGMLATMVTGASFATHTPKHAKVATKKMAAAMYECKHCNIQMTEKAAQAKGMKCDCGAKLTKVVKPTKPAAKG